METSMKRRMILLAVVCAALGLAACAGNKKGATTPGGDRSTSFSTSGETENNGPLTPCGPGAGREISEYDTSGDGHPDVRKVFSKVGEGALARLVLICRESDVN